MKKTIDFNPGDRVIYNRQGCKQETGEVTSYNDRFVFVRYGDEQHSKATDPNDLTHEFKSVKLV